MWTNYRADHQPEHPSDRRAYGSPDWVSDHVGANSFLTNSSSDTASDYKANHLHADHL